MIRTPIKRGQTWENKLNKTRCVIFGTSKNGWKVLRVDGKKETHSLTNQTLWTKFNLII